MTWCYRRAGITESGAVFESWPVLMGIEGRHRILFIDGAVIMAASLHCLNVQS